MRAFPRTCRHSEVVINWVYSHDLNTGLWLVETDHVTWILTCDWFTVLNFYVPTLGYTECIGDRHLRWYYPNGSVLSQAKRQKAGPIATSWWRRFQWSLKTLAWQPSPRGSQSRRQTRECWAGARGLTQATKFCQILIFMQLSSSWYSVSVSESPVGLVKV